MAPARRPQSAYPARVPEFVELWTRKTFGVTAAMAFAVTGALALTWPAVLWSWLIFVPLTLIGLADMAQKSHSIRRNFPVIGHLRYLLEMIRPEIRQYFVESDSEENPISREKRSIVYQRAKEELDTMPFGTRRNVYGIGYEWINHSLSPCEPSGDEIRVRIGEGSADAPYDASLLNISAMSFGALSRNAILALNDAARRGGFYHNTGEGGLSSYHLAPGGDLVWQIGTGYFGCRKPDGSFCPDTFRERAAHASVRMIEIKLSQGAKPGHGGVLPGEKVSEEIAAIRGVPAGETVISPPAHSAFGSPRGLLEFIGQLRSLSGGKPVGFKLCVGDRRQFLAICKAMVETGVHPDFITVDGAEGGTGAAPLEFSNSVGMPLRDGLSFVHSTLTGAGVRERVRLIAAGKITTGFHILTLLALGADLCNSARAMMLALGCVQALKCHTNQCPTGVATQDAGLTRGLVVEDKAERVCHFHAKTLAAMRDLLGAAGLARPSDLRPAHIFRRVSAAESRSFADLYPCLEPGSLARGEAPRDSQALWDAAEASSF
ncbi:MAG: FMN-binding glutamate synthase family protein [Myxococcota bacterium]